MKGTKTSLVNQLDYGKLLKMIRSLPKPLFYLSFCLLTYAMSPWIPVTWFYFLPLILGIHLIFRSSVLDGLGIVMAYLSIEGALKVFTQYNIFLRLAVDILIICLFLRLIHIRLKDSSGGKVFQAPFTVVFFLHVGWILVEFCNPHALGLLPSLAAYKVYISALLLYFLAYAAIEKPKDLEVICWIALSLVVLQVVTSAYQFQVGEAGMLRWSQNYQTALGVRFRGLFFRPFGTSNVAGGASTLIYLLTPMSLAFLLRKNAKWAVFWGGLLLLGVTYILFISQVRAALIKSLLGCSVMFLILMAKNKREVMYSFVFLITLAVTAGFFVKFDDSKFKSSEKRLRALSEFSSVWENRSRGSFDSVVQIVSEAPLGIGLSRVGAASEPFQDLIQKDLQFGPMWSFADNLYKALLIELGIPGLMVYMTFLILTFMQAARGLFTKSESSHVIFYQAGAMGALLASFAGHMGSEGFLYQPESTIVWIFIGSLVKLSQFREIKNQPTY